MALNDPSEKRFERIYTSKFSALAGPHGIPIKYEDDIAAIDLGLHLAAHEIVSNTRVWFQLKGKHKRTLPLSLFEGQESVSYDFEIEHIRSWYKSAEPVYLVLYVESADLFIAEDIADVVNRQWGDEILNPRMFRANQKVARVHLSTKSRVNDDFWRRLFRHRSMRIDGRSFRGRPLGHEHDPLTSQLRVMEPELFLELITDLLNEHGYKISEGLDTSSLFTGDKSSGNVASLTYGYLRDKFEVILSLTNEYLPNSDGTRHEGDSEYVQGHCAVLIHNKVVSAPCKTELANLAKLLVAEKKTKRLLVFVNNNMWVGASAVSTFHAYTDLYRMGLRCLTMHVEDLGFNLSVTTNTYNRFRDKVSWYGRALWHQQEGPFTIFPPTDVGD